MELNTTSMVKILRGSAKGNTGKVLDMSKKYDQLDVQLKDGSMRYVGYDDVEVINEKESITKRKLTNIEKGDLNNTLYEYKRAVTSKRQTFVRNNLYKLVEQILNAKRI